MGNSKVLGWVGANPPEGMFILIGRGATFYYFAHFFLFLPALSRLEPIMALPLSISRPIMREALK
jgi:quinol-cytochrome oxidoreductase complex cytochrome b subunit